MDWGKVIYIFFVLMSLTSTIGFLWEQNIVMLFIAGGVNIISKDGVAVVVIGRYLLHDGVAFHVGEEVYAPVGEHGVAHAAEVAAELRVVGDIGVFRGRGIGRTASAAGREQAQRHYKRQDDAESLFQLHHVVLQKIYSAKVFRTQFRPPR